jgi:hypothetical protein
MFTRHSIMLALTLSVQALCFQMAVNGLFGVFQSALLRVTSFRKLAGLPPRVKYPARPMSQTLADWRGGYRRMVDESRAAEAEAKKNRKNRF